MDRFDRADLVFRALRPGDPEIARSQAVFRQHDPMVVRESVVNFNPGPRGQPIGSASSTEKHAASIAFSGRRAGHEVDAALNAARRRVSDETTTRSPPLRCNLKSMKSFRPHLLVLDLAGAAARRRLRSTRSR